MTTSPPSPPCPHCDPTHDDPTTRPWGVHVDLWRDGDGKPTSLRVGPSDGSHVAESDAEWLWRLIRDATPRLITTAEEADALPEGSVVIDRFKVVSQNRGGLWCSYETARLDSRSLLHYGPLTVVHIPTEEAHR